MMYILNLIIAFAILQINASAFADEFSHADELYAQREDNREMIAAAREEYIRLIPVDPVRAIERIGVLAFYEGGLLLSANDRRRGPIFKQCRNLVERISDMESAKTVYHLFKLMCTGFWVESVSLLERLRELPEIKSYFNIIISADLEIRPELGIDLRYMGGGMQRILAKIYTNPLSGLLRSGLPNRDKARAMIDRAMASRAFPGDPNPGIDYYFNHSTKAEVLIGMTRYNDARDLIEETRQEILDRIDDDDLPVGMEPETKAVLNELDLLEERLR